MHKRILLFFLICLSVQYAYSQKLLQGRIVDYFTNQSVPDSMIEVVLLRADSVAIATANVQSSPNLYTVNKPGTQYFVTVQEEGNYIIRCSRPDYKTEYVPIKIKMYKKENFIQGPDIRLKREILDGGKLREVTVKATKLKFYFNKDTIVYNADAFITQYGFVLNDILHKMPGVKIEDGYQIYSNGRKVEELLLNGKDFFNGDRESLIENLPAYMIKNIKIYEHADSIELLKKQNRRPPLAMDIRLKKEYHSNVLGNIDIGGGTDERYFSRAFAMRIHDLYRWTAFAGSNNTNHNEDIDRNGQIYNMDNGSGDKKFHVAGFNYNANNQKDAFRLDGKVRIQGSHERQTYREISRNFYADGDVYNFNTKNTDARNFSIQTTHNLLLFPRKPYSVTFSPTFAYVHSKTGTNQAFLSAKRNIAELTAGDWTDSIKAKPLGQTLLMYGISRIATEKSTPTDVAQMSVNIRQDWRIPHTQDFFSFILFGLYTTQTSKLYEKYGVNYISDANKENTWKNLYQYNKNKNWQWGAESSYRWRFNDKHTLLTKAGYTHYYTSVNNAYYNLALIDGWGINSEHGLGLLPSQLALMDAMDRNNSHAYDEYSNRFSLSVSYILTLGRKELLVSLPFGLERRKLAFKQEDNDQTIRREMYVPDVELSFRKFMVGNTGVSYNLSFKTTKAMPAMFNLVNQRNDVYDLVVMQGNPHLKNSMKYELNSNFIWAPKPMQNHQAFLSYYYNRNQAATAILFDRNTGKYTYTPTNINGNQGFMFNITNSSYLDKTYKHKLSNEISYSYIKSVDFSGSTVAETAQKSTVNNSVITEKLEYGFTSRNTKYRGTLAPYVNYHRSTSDRAGFQTFDAYIYGLQTSVHVELPWSVRFNTELKSESRRGYNDDAMNDNEVIWNMGLTKAFRNNITISLNAVDMLGQRKNIYRVVTAQATSESVSNMLRRYVMLHFIWQFSKRK